jgi:hypothetical protein
VKVLLDECVDWRLARDIPGHSVKTARQMGWTTIKNGELLALAAAEFDVFVTVDRNLSFQQNLDSYPAAVTSALETQPFLAATVAISPRPYLHVTGRFSNLSQHRFRSDLSSEANAGRRAILFLA